MGFSIILLGMKFFASDLLGLIALGATYIMFCGIVTFSLVRKADAKDVQFFVTLAVVVMVCAATVRWIWI